MFQKQTLFSPGKSWPFETSSLISATAAFIIEMTLKHIRLKKKSSKRVYANQKSCLSLSRHKFHSLMAPFCSSLGLRTRNLNPSFSQFDTHQWTWDTLSEREQKKENEKLITRLFFRRNWTLWCEPHTKCSNVDDTEISLDTPDIRNIKLELSSPLFLSFFADWSKKKDPRKISLGMCQFQDCDKE